MMEMLIILLIPLILALVQCKKRFDKSWAYFCGSLFSFFITVSILPYTIPLAKTHLEKFSHLTYVCVFPVCGLVLSIVFYYLFILLSKGSKAEFPEKYLTPLKILLLYAGTLLQIVLLAQGTAPFFSKIQPETPVRIIDTTDMIIPRVMAFCGNPLSEHQKLWIRYGALEVLKENAVFVESDVNEEPDSAPAAEPQEKTQKGILTNLKDKVNGYHQRVANQQKETDVPKPDSEKVK